MRNKISTITLPVSSLERSLAFYRDGMGLQIDEESISSDHLAFQLENGPHLVLLSRQEFNEFSKLLGHTLASKGSSECILTYFSGTRDEVDSILAKAKSAGANPVSAQDKPWGYAGYFSDLDGHIWEVVHNPNMYTTEEKTTWN